MDEAGQFFNQTSDKIRAVFTERHTVIDHMEILTKMLECGFDPSGEVHLSLDSEMMVLKVPEYDRLFRLTENDKIIPGISIANSEVGILALSIEAFYYRLICSNGMIAKTSVDARYKHISRRVMDDFPLVLENVVCQSPFFVAPGISVRYTGRLLILVPKSNERRRPE